MRNAARLFALVTALGTMAGAQPGKASPEQRIAAARKYFSDVVLLNQEGREMRFYSDLIEDNTVIMIPFFTTCTSVCPPMNRNLERIQEWLGDRLGKDVVMMSITVDAENDTVPRLKEFSQRYHAKPGWYFLGGKKDNVDLALKKIGQYVDNKDDHNSIMILGNQRTGLWKKALALSKFEELLKVVASVVEDKGDGTSN